MKPFLSDPSVRVKIIILGVLILGLGVGLFFIPESGETENIASVRNTTDEQQADKVATVANKITEAAAPGSLESKPSVTPSAVSSNAITKSVATQSALASGEAGEPEPVETIEPSPSPTPQPKMDVDLYTRHVASYTAWNKVFSDMYKQKNYMHVWNNCPAISEAYENAHIFDNFTSANSFTVADQQRDKLYQIATQMRIVESEICINPMDSIETKTKVQLDWLKRVELNKQALALVGSYNTTIQAFK